MGTFHSLGTVSRGKTAVLLDFVQITFPQFGQLVQLFSDVEIQDLKDNLGLKVLYVLFIKNLGNCWSKSFFLVTKVVINFYFRAK